MSGFLGKIISFALISLFLYLHIHEKEMSVHHFSQGECHFVCHIIQQHLINYLQNHKSHLQSWRWQTKKAKQNNKKERLFQLEIHANMYDRKSEKLHITNDLHSIEPL